MISQSCTGWSVGGKLSHLAVVTLVFYMEFKGDAVISVS